MRPSPFTVALALSVSACPVNINTTLDDHDRAIGDSTVVVPQSSGEGEGEGEEGEGEVDPVPAGWTCADSYYDDSDCDCGCGVRDPTCPAGTGCTAAGCFQEACDFCFVAGGQVGACVDPSPLAPRCGDCSVDDDCQSGNCRVYTGQLDPDAICMVGCSSDAQCQGSETCLGGLCVAAELSNFACADADTLLRHDTACDRTLRFACPENSLCACTLSEGNASTGGSACVQSTCRAHCQACTDPAQCPAGDSCRFFTAFEAQGAVCSPPCVTDADCGSLGRCLESGFCGDLGANRCAGNSVVRDDQCGRALVVENCTNGCSGGACNP